MKKIIKETIQTIKKHTLLLVFSLIIFSKLLVFAHYNNNFPFPETLVPYLLYTLAATLIIILPAFFLYKKQATYLIIADAGVTIILIIDTLFIRFFDTLPVVSLIGITGHLSSLIPSVMKLFKQKDLLYLLDFAIIFTFYLLRSKVAWVQQRQIKIEKLSLKNSLLLAFGTIAFLTILLISDSRTRLPMLYNQISENKVVAKTIGIFGAHAIDISRNIIEPLSQLSDSQKTAAIEKLKKYSSRTSTNDSTGLAKNKRIIMIQLESLNNAIINEKINGQEITPNINKLVNSSNYFNQHTFTIGAGGTSDADFSVNTSIYPLADSSVFVKYGKNKFTSLEKELSNLGYRNYAYHANSRGYWNRDIAFSSLGFDKFYADDNYENGENVNMGLGDESFLEQTVEIIKQKPEKTLNYVITLSSHFSFETPKKNQTLNLSGKNLPKLSANYLHAIHYTDNALGEFINKLKNYNLYDDSLIVLYGDHSARYDSFNTDSKNIGFDTVDGKFVPLVVKLPGENIAVLHEQPTSHLDIMPTILNLVGAKPTSPMFGRDLFGKEPTYFFTSSYENNFDQIVTDTLKYLNNDYEITCSKKVEGKLIATDISACDGIISKRKDIETTVRSLIRGNLFTEYQSK